MPYINQIVTKVPQYRYSQKNIADFLTTIHKGIEKSVIEKILINAKIEYRNSVLPDFDLKSQKKALYKDNESAPSVNERMRVYESEIALLAQETCRQIDCNFTELTHLITVSCTGIAAPGLDIQLIKNLQLNTHIERHNVNFMGCFAAFQGMKLAKTICLAHPNAKVLLVCAELCTLHMQEGDELEKLISNSLFADGCAAALISNEKKGLELKDHFQEIITDTENLMSWNLSEREFVMRLSSLVPKHIENFASVLSKNSAEHQIKIHALHPGGRKIIEAYCAALNLDADKLKHSYEVLKNFGNMSSPTILFVLKEIMNADETGPIMALGFGPGLTVEGMILNKDHVQ
jgi:alpha-pyrone synthase